MADIVALGVLAAMTAAAIRLVVVAAKKGAEQHRRETAAIERMLATPKPHPPARPPMGRPGRDIYLHIIDHRESK